MAIGAVWEIFEFAMDGLFGLNMQKSGLVDTMWDLIVNMAGALVVSTAGAFYVRGGDSMLFDRLVRRLLEQGPRPSSTSVAEAVTRLRSQTRSVTSILRMYQDGLRGCLAEGRKRFYLT